LKKENAMKMMKTLFIAATFTALSAAGTTTLAQTAMDHDKMADTAAVDMTDGEVRTVDKEQGKVTLKHGPIKNLDMPGMTMVFTVKDKAMLEAVKAGDKVRFKAANDNGKMIVVEMLPAK
jgi:Cu(I)/Ag(I) efflux system periplasmic protein CusF